MVLEYAMGGSNVIVKLYYSLTFFNILVRNNRFKTVLKSKELNMLGLDSNSFLLIQTYLIALLSFTIVFIITVQYGLYIHRIRKRTHSSEVILIKLNVTILRILSIYLLVLQFPLLSHALSNPDKSSMYESIVRPIGGIVIISIGFTVNSHHILRWLFALGMLFCIGFDTTSQVILHNDIECLQRGSSCSGRMDNVENTKYYIWRDLMAIGGELWSFLLVSYLTIAIGVCSSRYSNRLLTSRVAYRSIREMISYHYDDTNKQQHII